MIREENRRKGEPELNSSTGKDIRIHHRVANTLLGSFGGFLGKVTKYNHSEAPSSLKDEGTCTSPYKV